MSTYTPPPFGTPDPLAPDPIPPQISDVPPVPQAPQAPAPAPVQPYVSATPQEQQPMPPAQPVQPAQYISQVPQEQLVMPPVQPVQPIGPYNPQVPYVMPTPQAPQPYVPTVPQAPYAQAPYYAGTAVPQRNQMVFVMSILILIGGAINLFVGFAVVAAGHLYTMSSGLYGFYCFILFFAAAYMIVLGILGIMNAAKPDKGALLFYMGIGCLVIPIISLIIGAAAGVNIFSGILGFLFPILFIIGANYLRKEAGTVRR